MVLLQMPTAAELLVWMGFLGCDQLILMSIWRIGTISLAVMKSVPSSASAAEAMTNLIICADCTIESSLDRKMWAPAWLCDLFH